MDGGDTGGGCNGWITEQALLLKTEVAAMAKKETSVSE
jgi:hypothetical protein